MINFPDTPTAGDHFTAGGTTWVWDGLKWTTESGIASAGGFLPLTGGTMAGPLQLARDPGVNLEAATKQYADTKLSLAGGTMTGQVANLLLTVDPTAVNGAATKRYADKMLPLTGGILTGDITLHGDPTQNLHPATKQYSDGKLPFSGGVLTGMLTLNSAPVNPLDAATKGYTDTAIRTRTDVLSFWFPGKPGANAQCNIAVGQALTVPVNLVGTVIYDGTMTGAPVTFIVNKLSGSGNVQLGGITITTASHTSCSMSGVGGSLNVGDTLQITAPSSPDLTLADVCISIRVVYQ